jgi:hypothetical protein
MWTTIVVQNFITSYQMVWTPSTFVVCIHTYIDSSNNALAVQLQRASIIIIKIKIIRAIT